MKRYKVAISSAVVLMGLVLASYYVMGSARDDTGGKGRVMADMGAGNRNEPKIAPASPGPIDMTGATSREPAGQKDRPESASGRTGSSDEAQAKLDRAYKQKHRIVETQYALIFSRLGMEVDKRQAIEDLITEIRLTPRAIQVSAESMGVTYTAEEKRTLIDAATDEHWGKIRAQLTEDDYNMLRHFNDTLEQRMLVNTLNKSLMEYAIGFSDSEIDVLVNSLYKIDTFASDNNDGTEFTNMAGQEGRALRMLQALDLAGDRVNSNSAAVAKNIAQGQLAPGL